MAGQKITITPIEGKPFKIDPKHDSFARHYAMSNNQTKSYLHAYGETRGATQSAAALMKRKPVILAIEYYRIKLSQALDISEARILAELAAIGFARPTDALDEYGDVLNPGDMSEATKRAISEYKVKVVNTTMDDKGNEVRIIEKSVKLGNKAVALRLLTEIKGYGKINEGGTANIKIINKL